MVEKAFERSIWRTALAMGAITIALCAITPAARAAVNFTNLIAFGVNAIPVGSMFQGRDGYYYVVTGAGEWEDGEIVRIAPDGLSKNEMSFPPGQSNGPTTPNWIIQGADGNFYGTSGGGGTNGHFGTVFRMDTNGVVTTMHSFDGTNGCTPYGLLQGRDGNFYGTAYAGGIGFSNGNNFSGYGTIFEVTTSGTFSTLVWFDGTNGANPEPMLFGADGNFYGVTDAGGADTNIGVDWNDGLYVLGYGVAYVLPTNGNFQVLASFNHTNAGQRVSPLIQGADGNFYGTTMGGGIYGLGTVFELTTNQTITTIASFDGTNGTAPYCLLQAPDGNFYGGTHGHGNIPWPNIFELTPSGTVTSLFSFGLTDGWPDGLIQGADGDFYGTTETGGGNGGWGTFFRVSVPVGPVLQTAMPSSGNVNLAWNAVAGQTYQVQYTADPASTNWTNLGGAIMATNGTLSLPDSPGSAQQRFYRVVIAQ